MLELLDSIIAEDYNTDNITLLNGRWSDLKNDSTKYDVFLFGTGRACDVFINRYEKQLDIVGVIDNNPLKWGSKFRGYDVYDLNVLNDKKEDSIVIITTTSYMNDIANQLDEIGYKKYYGFAVLESRNFMLRILAIIIKYFLWYLLPVKKDRILISNGFSNYCDNGKAIVEQLISDGYEGDILWLNPNYNCTYPKRVKLVQPGVINRIIAHSTSKIWVDGYKKQLWIKKKASQYYINVWHGGIALKKLDFDTVLSSQSHLKRVEYDSDIIDARISNSKALSSLYRNAMHYKGKIFEFGMPKADCLFNGKYAKGDFKKVLGISKSSKIVLYAPTWRPATRSGFQGRNDIELDFDKLKATLEKKFGGEFYVLLRLHPEAKRISLPSNTYLIDVSQHADVYEILNDCDVLISDYSSLLFEMGFIHKPVFLYSSDYEEYKEYNGIYFDYSDMPYPYAFSQEQLENEILLFDYEKYRSNVSFFNKEVLGVVEKGVAAKETCRLIYKILNKL